jgi:hypothetical protein
VGCPGNEPSTSESVGISLTARQKIHSNMEYDQNEINELIGKPVKLKKKFQPATNFSDALLLCTPPEQQFIRHILADKKPFEAYRLARNANLDRNAAAVGARTWLKRPNVVSAIELAKAEGGAVALSDIKFDVRASFDELGRVYDAAMVNRQFTAAARAAELRAKLFKLLDNPNPQQAQAVTFVFKRFNEDPVIETQFTEVQP